MGVSDDTALAYFYAWARVLRIVDGPDAVHRRTIARDGAEADPAVRRLSRTRRAPPGRAGPDGLTPRTRRRRRTTSDR